MNVGDRYVWVHNNHGMASGFVGIEFRIHKIESERVLITYSDGDSYGNWTKEVIEENARLLKRENFQTLYNKLL